MFCRDDAENDGFALWKILQGCECSSSLAVVLEIEKLIIERLEQFLRESVPSAGAEMDAAREVATAEMHPNLEVGGQVAQHVVVGLHVQVQQGFDVCALGSLSGDEILIAKEGEIRVIDLDEAPTVSQLGTQTKLLQGI